VQVDEGGAPEWIAGTKLLTVPTPDGKLTPELVEPLLGRLGDEHAVQPRVITVTQSTELGTLYTPDELQALTAFAHERDMLVHLDGARLANAAAALGVGLGAITTDVGVDVVAFGGTKNGLVLGEAVVFLREGLADHARYLRKQSMQLASKGRFLAAGFVALLEDGLWQRSAAHANAMAALLHERVAGLPGVRVTQAVQANGVFAILDSAVTRGLQERWPFYVWDEATGEVRWLCSWDTTEQDVEAFAADVAAGVGAGAVGAAS
jgi:threonine aldolase